MTDTEKQQKKEQLIKEIFIEVALNQGAKAVTES